jgi:hypothetical protein
MLSTASLCLSTALSAAPVTQAPPFVEMGEVVWEDDKQADLEFAVAVKPKRKVGGLTPYQLKQKLMAEAQAKGIPFRGIFTMPRVPGTFRAIRTHGRNMFRLTAADLRGDEDNSCIVGSTLDNRVCAFDLGGKHLWDYQADGFVIDLAAGDVNGDGRDEVFAASTSGVLHCLSHDGKLLWQFDVKPAPLWAVEVLKAKGRTYVACATPAGGLYALSSDGELKAAKYARTTPSTSRRPGPAYPIRTLRSGDFDNDGDDELCIGLQQAGKDRIAFVEVPDLTKDIWEGYGLSPMTYSGIESAIMDIDGDGDVEVVGPCYIYNPNKSRLPVVKTPGGGVYPGLPLGGGGYRMRSWTGGHYKGDSTVFAAGIHGTDLTLMEIVGGRTVEVLHAWRGSDLSFTDIITVKQNGRDVVVLGGVPNGDDSLYVVTFFEGDEDLYSQISTYKPSGVIGKIHTQLREIDEQLAGWRGTPAVGLERPVNVILHDFQLNHIQKYKGSPKEIWGNAVKTIREEYMERFPYPNIRFVLGLARVDGDVSNYRRPDGKEWAVKYYSVPYRYSKTAKAKELATQFDTAKLVEIARYFEQEEIHFMFQVGHSAYVSFDPKSLAAVQEAAPTYFRGGHLGENAYSEPGVYLVENYFDELARIFAQARTDKVLELVQHPPRWTYHPTLDWKRNLLHSPHWQKVFSPGCTEARCVNANINLMSAFGLFWSGQVNHLSAYLQADDLKPHDSFDWCKVMSGHPHLRHLMFMVAMGASHITFHLDTHYPYGSTEAFKKGGTGVLNRGIAQFLHLLGKGVIRPPRRSQMENISKTALVYENQGTCGFLYGHSRPVSSEDVGVYNRDIINQGHIAWTFAPTAEHSLNRYTYGERHQGLQRIVSTAHGGGIVPICPRDVCSAESYFKSVWKGNEFGFEKDGRRITDPKQFRKELLADIETNAKHLPIRIWGEAVFPQVVRQGDDGFHVYLIDAGFFDPKDRVAKIRVQLDGAWEVRDRMTQEVLNPSVKSREDFTIDVPAGLFRLLEIRRRRQ